MLTAPISQSLEDWFEIRHGTQLLTQYKKTEIEHFIYPYVGGEERQSGVSHFESKWRIEDAHPKNWLSANP